MATADSFLPDILPHVSGCPNIIAQHALRNAVIRFCEESLIWRESLPAMAVVNGQSEYPLSTPEGTRIVRVLAVTYDGAPLAAVSGDALDSESPDWRTNGTDRGYIAEDPELLRLTFAPGTDIAAGLVVRVALKPTRAATEYPDTLYEEWAPAIAAGALAALMLQVNTAWTNPAAAAVYAGAFQDGVTRATRRAHTGFARPVMRTKPVFY